MTCSPHTAETVGGGRRGARRGTTSRCCPVRAAVPGGAGHGARRLRAAVAAPARHRRDVHGPAPPHPLSAAGSGNGPSWPPPSARPGGRTAVGEERRPRSPRRAGAAPVAASRPPRAGGVPRRRDRRARPRPPPRSRPPRRRPPTGPSSACRARSCRAAPPLVDVPPPDRGPRSAPSIALRHDRRRDVAQADPLLVEPRVQRPLGLHGDRGAAAGPSARSPSGWDRRRRCPSRTRRGRPAPGRAQSPPRTAAPCSSRWDDRPRRREMRRDAPRPRRSGPRQQVRRRPGSGAGRPT